MQTEQLRAKAEAGQPESQFLLSQICLQNHDVEGMIYWLTQASDNQLADALDALGHCHEKGLGVPRDFAAALTCYDRAVKGGAHLAAYRKAELLYKSRQGRADEELIRELLLNAANADLVPALRTMGFLAMQQKASRSMALDLLRRAAQRGDEVSNFNLGWYLLQGEEDEDVKPEAAQCLQRAAGMKYPFAEVLLASLRGVPPTPPQQPFEERIELNTSFSLFPEPQSVDHQVLSKDPAITLFNNVLNVVDCAYLIFHSRPYLQRADVIDPTSQKGGMVSDVRTNLSTYLPFGIVDIISRYIELKIVRETGEDLVSSEPMSILCYAPGEYYRPHVDYFNPNLDVSLGLMEDGGQRTASAITYLCAPMAGGGTSFPRLNVTTPAQLGSTLWFRNCRDDGQVDDRTLHAGDTVEQGEKWVITKWFRERPTRYLEF